MALASELPRFKYHPQPLATGTVVRSDDVCECCGQSRGFIYQGPIYAAPLQNAVCPWCIADGAAHAKWDAQFTDVDYIGGNGKWCDVPQEVWEEVSYRTPGIAAIQQAQWWTHCGDAAEILGIEGDWVRFRCRVCGETGGYRDID